MLNYIPLVLLIIAGLIWLIGHIPRAIKKDSHLSIDYAGYGEQFGQYRNVTRQVQKLVEEKRLPIPVDDKSMGCDPNPGNRKCLFVIYSHGSHEGRAAGFTDGQLLVLPPDR